ncbi:MAG: hypothetical protein FJ249_05735 [Nitrospira sp.]|nr:hypothetical protein [Nitrospira sp.]
MKSANRRGAAALPLMVLFLCTACAEGARFLQLNEQGGVVAYPLKKGRQSIYASPFRAEALHMIEERCPKGYRIIQEGETQGETRNSGLDADDLLTTRRFWGLQFRCK